MDYALICIAPSNLLSLAMLCVFVAAAQADFPEVSKLPSQPGLPDPLLMFEGEPGRPKPVADKEQWIAKRRPELKALFQHYMYGYTPAAPARVTPTIEREDSRFFGGKATKKEVTIAFGPPDCPKIHLLLVIPNERKGPAPVFLGMNFCGNHALVKDPSVALPTAWIYSHYPGVKDNRATGTKVKAGLVGTTPSLIDLQDGDLKMSIDFRRVYAMVLEQWLKLPSKVALGENFESLPLFNT